MAQPFSQDVRAAQLFLITDGITENNPQCDCDDDCECGGSVLVDDVRYCRYDDSIQGIRANMFRDPENIYFYVPVGSYTTERRIINEDFITNYLAGKGVVMINSFYPMSLQDSTLLSKAPHWIFAPTKSFERLDVLKFNPTWRGYNMVSQYYWLSDEEMLTKPEYIECASWSIPKVDIHALNNQYPIEVVSDDQEVIDYLEAMLGNVAFDTELERERLYAQLRLQI